MPKHVGGIWIEGKRYDSPTQLYKVACSMGFNGSQPIFMERLRSGRDTWAELMKPVSTNSFAAAKVAKAAKRTREAAEMAELCRQLDERKRLIEGAA